MEKAWGPTETERRQKAKKKDEAEVLRGFPGGSDSKESACNAGDLGLIPGLGRSLGGGQGNPLQYSCLENPHRQRSLVGYSPRGSQSVRHY